MITYLKKKIKFYYYLFFTKNLTEEDSIVLLYLSDILPRNNTTLVDIGANIGVWSSRLLKLIDINSSLLVFEPLPKANFILSKKFKQQINNGTLLLYDFALSSDQGTAKLQLYNNDSISPAANIFTTADHLEQETFSSIEVITDTLDNIITCQPGLNKPSFIKIDVEGHELDVVKGAINTIKDHRPIMYIEILREKWHNNNSSSDLTEMLSDIGYEIMQVKNNKLMKIDGCFINESENFLFIPK